MLNELHDLNASMEEAGIVRQSWHKDYKQCPKNNTFFLLISSEGTPSGLKPINNLERIQKLRKYEVANGISFPAFNVQPMLHAQNDAAKNAVKRLKDTVKSHEKERKQKALPLQFEEVWESCEILWVPSETDRINKCLQSAGLKDKLSKAATSMPDAYRAFQELQRRLETLTADHLQQSLKQLVRGYILTREDANDWIETLLVSSAKSPKRVSLVFELSDSSSFPYPVNHPALCSWVNAQLMAEQPPGTTQHASAETDAFGKGLEKGHNDEAFPAVNLPQVGKVILRAMSSESPCQKRYGRVDAHSFPACRGIRQAMKDALEWLCDKERKGKTWADASGACGFTKRDGKKVPVSGLFLVYPSSLGPAPPELAGFFFGENGALDPDGAKFESAAARVTSAMRIMVGQHPKVEVRVLYSQRLTKRGRRYW